MTTRTTPLRNWEQELKEEKAIDFYTSRSDSGHIIVSRHKGDGTKETIGHVYVEVDGDEIRYFSTNKKGREIFPPTTDFNLVEMNYERYSRLFAIRGKTKENNKQLNITNQFKNPNIMKTQTQSPEQKPKRENQLRFIEYEKAAGDGHFMTIADSYHNVIGRVHKSYNDQTKKYEYLSYDHAGNLMGKNEKLWELKKEFITHRDQLLEQAHQRRIESNEKTKQERTASMQTTKGEAEKEKHDDQQKGKTNDEKQIMREDEKPEGNREQDREQELDDLREEKEDERGDIDFDR